MTLSPTLLLLLHSITSLHQRYRLTWILSTHIVIHCIQYIIDTHISLIYIDPFNNFVIINFFVSTTIHWKMPPKGEGKAMLTSPIKVDSYASVAGSGGVASRTRGAGGRRPSNEGLESIATQADLAQYDNEQSHGSGTRSAVASSSSSSTPILPPTMTPEMAQMITGLYHSMIQSQPPTGTTSVSGSSGSRAKAPSTTKPAGISSSSSSLPSVALPTTTSNRGITIEPSVQRLVTSVAAHAGIPILPMGAVTPGGIPAEDHRQSDHERDDDDNDDGDEPPTPNANDLNWRHIHVAERDRYAPSSIRKTLAAFSSFQARAQVMKAKDIRSKHEVDFISIIVDAALAERTDVILELAIRRLIGVEAAENNEDGKGRDWDTATALDLTKPGSLVNEDLARRLRKDVAQIRANRVKEGGGAKSRTAAGTGGAWNSKKKNNKKGGGGAHGGAAAARS